MKFKFKPGDVVSQFDDNHALLCVDEIGAFDKEIAEYEGKQYIYTVSERGFGLTSLEPKDFHLVPDDVREKYFETLKSNGVIFENGKFKAIEKK